MRKIFSEPTDPYINRSVLRSAFQFTFHFSQQSSFRIFIARSLLSPVPVNLGVVVACVSKVRISQIRRSWVRSASTRVQYERCENGLSIAALAAELWPERWCWKGAEKQVEKGAKEKEDDQEDGGTEEGKGEPCLAV